MLRLVSAEVVNGTVSQHSHNQTSLARLQYSAGQGQEAEQERLYMEEEELSATTNAGLVAVLGNNITICRDQRLELERRLSKCPRRFYNHREGRTTTSAFTFMTLSRHYAIIIRDNICVGVATKFHVYLPWVCACSA